MPMTSKQMIKFLKKNGFTYIPSGDGSHKKFKNFETGKVTTVPDHGGKDLPKGTEPRNLETSVAKIAPPY